MLKRIRKALGSLFKKKKKAKKKNNSSIYPMH
ncbi:hypothetical protein ACVK1X_004314 [Pseudomonas sp. PvR086]|jgi:hypothetical protein|nr:hypothetical protein [Pseudomonas sp. GGS8]MDR7108942.1 hypothetical protein [Pseudomonas frederiksbergensis]PZW59482.1 hypothetical protein F475_03428 [Pseudomonas sp. URMO17WK12:I6]CAH0191385.1 hypothetical protein SRABI130_01766 [Pseudomonas sp. Bi130]